MQDLTIYDPILRSTIPPTSHDLTQDPDFDNLGRDSESNDSEDYDSQYSGNDQGESPSDRDDDVDYYDGDTRDGAKTEPLDMGSDAKSEEFGLENVLEATGKEVEEADNVDYDDYPYGRPLDWNWIIDGSSRSCP